MKYSEAKQQIEALSNNYGTSVGITGDFNIYYKGKLACWVSSAEYDTGNMLDLEFKKLPYANKLYTIMAELAITPYEDRKNQNKYYVHVLKGHSGYLNVGKIRGVFINSKKETSNVKTIFSGEEIKKLKQRQDVPLDWSKVELEPVN